MAGRGDLLGDAVGAVDGVPHPPGHVAAEETSTCGAGALAGDATQFRRRA